MSSYAAAPFGARADIQAMSSSLRFSSYGIVAFVGTTKPRDAKHFYGDILGLHLTKEDEFALVFDAHGTPLRVTTVRAVVAAEYTVVGWLVPDVRREAARLQEAGVQLARYPGMEQDELGVWKTPAGGRVAWFKDPDGNTLSISGG
jgi:catechol 2,3-dioxygenase-like lactoylglutathione lyase family enzyme